MACLGWPRLGLPTCAATYRIWQVLWSAGEVADCAILIKSGSVTVRGSPPDLPSHLLPISSPSPPHLLSISPAALIWQVSEPNTGQVDAKDGSTSARLKDTTLLETGDFFGTQSLQVPYLLSWSLTCLLTC
jgi:hypothetical protein